MSGRKNVFERATLIVELFHSQDFLAKHNGSSALVYDALKPHFEDMYYEPRDLEVLLKYAPEQEKWEGSSLKKLWAEMCVSQAKRHDSKKTPTQHRDEALREKVRALEEENAKLKTEVRTLRKRLSRIEKSMKA